jgi:AcrR family transcriptional regulator
MEPLASWRAYGAAGLPRILDAALTAFAEQGYHGTSIRDIAARAGLSVPGVYHHYRAKQDILLDLITTVMGDLLTRSRAAVESAGDDPAARFDALVESLLRLHMFRSMQAFVASSEIRSLSPRNRASYVAMRDEQQSMLEELISQARESGAFTTSYPKDAARAVATLCVGVASWFRADGPLRPEEIVERYLGFARALVGGR